MKSSDRLGCKLKNDKKKHSSTEWFIIRIFNFYFNIEAELPEKKNFNYEIINLNLSINYDKNLEIKLKA